MWIDRLKDLGSRSQLLALEWLLGVGMPDKLKEAPLAVKALYDEDIADEVRARVLQKMRQTENSPKWKIRHAFSPRASSAAWNSREVPVSSLVMLAAFEHANTARSPAAGLCAGMGDDCGSSLEAAVVKCLRFAVDVVWTRS